MVAKKNHPQITDNKKIDVAFVAPFLKATVDVLKEQAGIEAKRERSHLLTPQNIIQEDVSGLIQIHSPDFRRWMMITFSEKVFLSIMSKMLDEDFTEWSHELLDGVGEISNMIFGQAKVILNQKGLKLQMAIPSVCHGKNQRHSALSSGAEIEMVISTLFSTDYGKFHVLLGV